jgi:hypothetical protein
MPNGRLRDQLEERVEVLRNSARAKNRGGPSLFGLSHGIIDQGQYSALVAAVIGSAVIPTIIANAFYLPRHLLPEPDEAVQEEPVKPLRAAARAD